jgi:hypothetical protein
MHCSNWWKSLNFARSYVLSTRAKNPAILNRHAAMEPASWLKMPTVITGRVQMAIEQLTTQESYAIIDKGLYSDERSCILIENGKFVGMGYLPIDAGLNDLDSLRSYIKPHKESFYIREILQSESLTANAQRISFEYSGN